MQPAGRHGDASGVILWDAFGLQTLHSGVGRHAWDLLQALEKAACSPRIIPSVASIDGHFLGHCLPKIIFWPRSRIKPWALFWTGSWIKSFLRQSKQNCVLHALSNYNLPPVAHPRLHKVLTVHDLIPVLQRQEVSAALGYYLRYQLPRAIAAADAIICVSAWTESTLHDVYPASRGRTLMIPNGWPRYDIRPDKAPSRRLLTVSRLESYKRLDLIPEILRHLPADYTWTVVTDRHGIEALRATADPRLILRTGLGDEELLGLHKAAGVYVHPSLFEGFCLPAAASISQGVPVIYTRASGIDEVVAEAGIGMAVSATPQRWAATIEELLADDHYTRACQARCQSAASWDDVAARTRALYDKLGER